MTASFAAQQDPNAWTDPVTKAALIGTALMASGNFSERIIPGGEESNPQQYVVLALWLVIVAVSYFRRPLLQLEPTPSVLLALAPYALAVASFAWSDNPGASLPKAVALLIVTFGAYRLAMTMALDAIVDCVILGTFLLAAASVLLALFVPDIGVLTDFQHPGQWNGIFVSKQTLGIHGALLLFFAAYRLMEPPRALYHYLAALTAIACVIGSGSRGGGAIAVAGVVFVYGARRSTLFSKIVAFAPFAMCLVASVLIAYFVWTGNQSLQAFDKEIDFTERTFIWQYALSFFTSAPLLGYGVNGFWTLKEVKDVFLERHGWFLDNFHDGYIGIVVETGALGFVSFAASYFAYGRRIAASIAERGAIERDVALTLTYTCILFFIDFTETFFLRSTNLFSALLSLSVFIGFAQSAPTRHESAAFPPEPATRYAPPQPRETYVANNDGVSRSPARR